MQDSFPDDRQAFREAMSRMGVAVNIITTTGPAGDAGLTASAVCAVTDDPPMLLVCINRKAKLNEAFKANGILCVNVLAPEHQELSPVFASVGEIPMTERFARAAWLRLKTGAPALASAAASFDCTIDAISELGTHSVFFCGAKVIRLGSSAAGLIYHGRAYHTIGPAAA